MWLGPPHPPCRPGKTGFLVVAVLLVVVAVAVDSAVLLETTVIDQRPNILISVLVSIMAEHVSRTVIPHRYVSRGASSVTIL